MTLQPLRAATGDAGFAAASLSRLRSVWSVVTAWLDPASLDRVHVLGATSDPRCGEVCGRPGGRAGWVALRKGRGGGWVRAGPEQQASVAGGPLASW